MRRNKHISIIAILLISAVVITSCSTTSAIPDGEQLYTGMKSTKYENYEKNDHFITTQEELEYVLATKPNAALFGSSTYRSPFPIGLWIWNAFSNDSTAFSRWITRAFGTKPVLMSHVNPELRVSVGENMLRKRGYFNGKINFETLPQSNPKKSKLAYKVDLGHLWTVDSISYINFPAATDSVMNANISDTYIKKGAPFDISELENERLRIADLFRDNGYYYYDKNNASYLADTVSVPGKVQLRLQMLEQDDIKATHEWYIGNVVVNFRKTFNEKLDSTRHTRNFTVNYNGKRMPVRMRVLRNNLKLRAKQLYSREKHEESQKLLNSTGLFTTTTFTFTPRDTTVACNTLDMNINCVFDKPYDFYVEAYGKGKTSGKYGPEMVVGLTRRNAFRGGELLDINLHGSYEWQTGHSSEGTSSGINSYEYGGEASIHYPRILNPFSSLFKKKRTTTSSNGQRNQRRRRTRYYDTPSTVVKAAMNTINRATYFKRHIVSGEIRYNWRKTAQTSFEFTPLSLAYEYMNQKTDSFMRLQEQHPYLKVSMADQFIPKMSFSHSYHSPESYRSPISWWTTVSEASNILAAGYAAFGKDWSEKNKELFKNPFAQFLKLETNFTKTWRLTEHSSIAAHVNGGVIWSYGNSVVAPYTEQFYAGGANTIRAFNVRSIGPGKYRPADNLSSYVEQTGDIKFLANIEYRPRLFGKMYGAIFIDAGNVWAMKEDDNRPGAKFKFGNMFKELAVGTGIGLRYDLSFFIIRLDWGIGLHVPYETGRSGFYNIGHFNDAQTLHLAIGLPF